MSRLIPVIYKNMNYPPHIEANIHEVSGNFHKEKLVINSPYSLHTEPSYGQRIFCLKIVNNLKHIILAQKNGIPQLWYNKEWANDFYLFIDHLIPSNKPPEVLEIHPPFNDYCSSFDQFLNIFKVFYNKFKIKYPTTTIVIENRFGTRNKEGRFLLSTCDNVLTFCETLSIPINSDIKLKIVLDYPQLFSAKRNLKEEDWKENWMGSNPEELVESIISFNQKIKKYRELIGGFHMWGKKLKIKFGWIPHAGNFDTFFSNDKVLKEKFLKSVSSTFDDDIARYFVPEVNSGEDDLLSIINDMEQDKRFIFPQKISGKCGT